jgi:uncharacterized membrane protein YebE (DUF533 family)
MKYIPFTVETYWHSEAINSILQKNHEAIFPATPETTSAAIAKANAITAPDLTQPIVDEKGGGGVAKMVFIGLLIIGGGFIIYYFYNKHQKDKQTQQSQKLLPPDSMEPISSI